VFTGDPGLSDAHQSVPMVCRIVSSTSPVALPQRCAASRNST
jgi:hypothetical protein